MLGFRCGVCGGRSLRRCGTRKQEVTRFPDGGRFVWRLWSPCSEALPGGVRPPRPLLEEDGGLDDLSDVGASVVAIEGGLLERIDEIKALARSGRLDEVHPSHLLVLIDEVERLRDRSGA